jgi:hypothetical protein
MRVFACPHCAHVVHFEATVCVNCGTALAYDPVARTIARADAAAPCANAVIAACNWQAPAPGELCASCRFTRTRPADGDRAGLAGFALVEGAKRRLLFELAELELPLERWDERAGGLGFDLLSSAQEAVVTGHADGIVTIDLAEADPVHRERLRVELGEPYRTLLGHLRHEVGHWYQGVLVAPGSEREEACRRLFGDERADYQEALRQHYAQGPPPGWRETFVSAYATMHPWEDWAETFAHYLHIADTVQTALAYGVRVEGPPGLAPMPPDEGDFASIMAGWLPLTYALNALNRSMGAEDLYPFVLVPPVIEKLEFVHRSVVGNSKH